MYLPAICGLLLTGREGPIMLPGSNLEIQIDLAYKQLGLIVELRVGLSSTRDQFPMAGAMKY